MFVIERGFLGRRMSRISFDAVQAGLANGTLRRFFANVVIRNDVAIPPPPDPDPEPDKIVLELSVVDGLSVTLKPFLAVFPVTVNWGDNDTSTVDDALNIAHTYDSPGTFQITATDANLKTGTLAVTVAVAPAGSSATRQQAAPARKPRS